MKVVVFCLSTILTGTFIMASFKALQAAQNIVPVAVTAAETVQQQRSLLQMGHLQPPDLAAQPEH